MIRRFEDAMATANQMLAAAMSKQIEPVYCVKCGARLQVRTVQLKGFGKDTGYPEYDVMLRCRRASLYETSLLGKPLFTWKSPFSRHSVQKVSRIIELNPDIADAHYRRGDAYHEMGEYVAAIANYDLAIRLNPNHALAYYNRGVAYHKEGQVPRAMDDLQKCTGLSTDPELTKAAERAIRKIEGSS